MPHDEAKPDVERLGLPDILTTLCPGAMLLASTAIWLPLNNETVVKRIIDGTSSVSVSFLLLLVSYALGLVLNAWADQGFVAFLRLLSLIRMVQGPEKLLTIARLAVVALLHGRKYKSGSHPDRHDLAARFDIYELIRERYGDSVVSLLTKSNLFYVFRVLVWCLVRDREEVALKEADALFRRRGFAQGVALALMLAGLQGTAVLGLIFGGRIPRDPLLVSAILGIVVGSFLGSFVLRNVAWRLHSDEQIFSYAVLRSAKKLAESSALPAT
jgi:hypothetical protein